MAPQNKKITDAWMAIYMSIAKLTDSGLGIFVILGSTAVGTIFALTWGLDSKDRLAFLQEITRNPILPWGGWVVALVTIWVARWLLKRERTFCERELKRVDEVKDKALKQQQLNLNQPDTGPQ